MAGGKISQNDARLAHRTYRALELRAQGKTYREIEDLIREEFNQPRYTYSQALKDCDRAMAQLVEENSATIHKLRGLELARYDDYLNKIYAQVEAGDIDAVNCALKISAARAKILGLYAPVEVKVHQIVESRVEEELSYFFESVNESDLIPEHIKELLYSITDELQERLALSAMNVTN